MADNKTLPTGASVDAFLGAVPDAARRADCERLAGLMARATGEPAVMWGVSIVGFGSVHYRYDSGREGDMPLVGFSPRKGDLSLYVLSGDEAEAALLARLGRHKAGKACLNVRRLADVDLAVLEQLVAGAVDAMRRRYGEPV